MRSGFLVGLGWVRAKAATAMDDAEEREFVEGNACLCVCVCLLLGLELACFAPKEN